MKALIRKHGSTPTTEAQDEIFPESSWPDWVDANGWPLTDENYGYALCQECPDDVRDLDVDDFTVRPDAYMETDEFGNQHERTRWIAIYKGQEILTPTGKLKEIEDLKKKLASLESDL